MSHRKRIYLIGGLGNNLFQVEKSLSSLDSRVDLVTNLIEDSWYSRLFGWTYHKETVTQLSFRNEISFTRLNTLLVLFHLCLLFFSKRINTSFLGVSWNSKELTRVNFGYWQSSNSKSEITFRLRMNTNVEVNQLPVVHARLGDSPTLHSDLRAQLDLMLELNFEKYLVITNDKDSFIEYTRNLDLKFDVYQRTVSEDLFTLLSAKTLIIPRSTFSLCASLMSANLKVLYVDRNYWLSNRRDLGDVLIKYYPEKDLSLD